MRVRHVIFGGVMAALAACPLAAQTPILGGIEAPYPALQSPVRIAGGAYGAGAVSYGPVNTPLVLSGSDFGSSGTVQFIPYASGVAGTPVQATVTLWTPIMLVVAVPSGASSGLVTVMSQGETSNGLPFIVTPGSYANSCPTFSSSSQLQIVTSSLEDGRAGQAYSATLNATGGASPYTWSLPGNQLPSGLSLAASSGVISGTPTVAAGPISLTVEVTDSNSQTTDATLTITIGGAAPGTQPVVYSYSIPAGGYDAVGNVLNYTDSVTGTWSSIVYDGLNRLTSASSPSGSSGPYAGLQMNWSYDDFGNRTGENFSGSTGVPMPTNSSTSYNANNQISGTSLMLGAAPPYDAAGDVTQDNQNQYLYDAEGRICAVKNLLVGAMTEYLYDAEGNRVAKGTIANWSAGCDTTQNGFTMTASYILGPGNQQLTELPWASNSGPVLSSPPPAGWHTNAFAAGQLMATFSTNPDPNTSQTMPAILNYYLTDWLGTRRVMTDSLANVQETCDSLPYGDGETCSPSPTEHLFTGKERDTESGNDYFGARYYASSMGRFTSPDWSSSPMGVPYASLGNPQSLNLYSYVLNMPLGAIDPDGHDCVLDGQEVQQGLCNSLVNAGFATVSATVANNTVTTYTYSSGYDISSFNVNESSSIGPDGSISDFTTASLEDYECDLTNPVCGFIQQEIAGLAPSNDPDDARILALARGVSNDSHCATGSLARSAPGLALDAAGMIPGEGVAELLTTVGASILGSANAAVHGDIAGSMAATFDSIQKPVAVALKSEGAKAIPGIGSAYSAFLTARDIWNAGGEYASCFGN